METAILKPKEERRLLRGHLWAYRNEFAQLPPMREGELVDVVSESGRFVGRGFYQSEGGIAVRVLARKPQDVDSDFLAHRVHGALRYREQLFPGETVYRWLYGESDRLPGLVADRYGSVVSAHSSCSFYLGWLDTLAQAFLSHEGVEGVRFEVAGETREFGNVPTEIPVDIDGLRLKVSLERGQKTGMFLDQRENWQAMRPFAKGARVLDGYCYMGAWSCEAARFGAASVLGVDSSARAVEMARENADANGVGETCRFEAADVTAVLNRGERYDLVMLDPPALAKTRGQLTRALGLYQSINRDAMQALEPGGYLITSSCSHHVDLPSFIEVLKRAARAAQRDIWVVDIRGAARDHPMLLSMPETVYLKNVTLRVF
jgi:23S rRNA (cytosine1962-C5)-methyltransferase